MLTPEAVLIGKFNSLLAQTVNRPNLVVDQYHSKVITAKQRTAGPKKWSLAVCSRASKGRHTV